MNAFTAESHAAPDDPQDREWLVFRYVAGEMPELERREFELLLLEDQPLREAVAEMVCLTRSVSLSLAAPEPVAGPEVAPAEAAPLPARWLVWRLVWGSATVAALAAAFFVGWTARPLPQPSRLVQPDQPPATVPVGLSEAQALALVSHWSAGETLVNPTLVNPEDGELMTESGLPLSETELALNEAGPADADNLNVPEWMLLAVNPAANSIEGEEN